MIGIYQIKCNDSYYIGSSTKIQKRLYEHIRTLKLNKHHNKHMQRLWNKYGEQSFIFTVLEECTLEGVKRLEQVWLDILFSSLDQDNVININKQAELSRLGAKLNEDQIKRLSDSHKGIRATQQAKDKISRALKGKKNTQEHRDKVSKSIIGHKNYYPINPVYVIHESGLLEYITNVKNFCVEYSLDHGSVSKVINKKRNVTKGWRLYESFLS